MYIEASILAIKVRTWFLVEGEAAYYYSYSQFKTRMTQISVDATIQHDISVWDDIDTVVNDTIGFYSQLYSEVNISQNV